MVGDREAAVSAGCDGYLEKPIDPDRFVLELQRLLGVDAGSRP
jgi:CheY-like chemotaxis protein